MTRTALTLAALLVATTGPAAEPTKAELAAAEAKLAAFRTAVGKSAVAEYDARGWAAVGTRTAELGTFAKELDGLAAGLSTLQTAARSLAKAVDERDAKKRASAAAEFLKVLADSNPKAGEAKLNTILRNTGDLRPRVVGEASADVFKLTAAELAKDPKKALSRVAAWKAAMTANLAALDAQAKALQEVVKKAEENHKALSQASGNIEAFVQKGGVASVNSDSVNKYFEAGILKKYTSIAGEAKDRLADIKAAKAAQEKHLKAVEGAAKALESK